MKTINPHAVLYLRNGSAKEAQAIGNDDAILNYWEREKEDLTGWLYESGWEQDRKNADAAREAKAETLEDLKRIFEGPLNYDWWELSIERESFH